MISRERYLAAMEKRSRAKGKPLRRFKVGDLVTRHRPTLSERVNKLAYLQDGPFKVLQVQPLGTSYIIKRSNSDKQRVLVHVDEIISLRGGGVCKRSRSGKQGAQNVPTEEQALAIPKSRKNKSRVEMFMAERDHNDHGKRYLVVWSGESDEGKRKLQEDMDCDERACG